MPWDTSELRRRFGHPANSGVIVYLEAEHPSAHDDVASVLIQSARDLPGSGWFCPNPPAYAYVLLHTHAGIIYGLATGMNQLAFRLPMSQHAAATKAGATACAALGADWFTFEPWGPRAGELRHWCQSAFTAADSTRRNEENHNAP